jgi:hypothetical protein
MLGHLKDVRSSTVIFHLAKHLNYGQFRDANDEPRLHLSGQCRGIVRSWLEGGGPRLGRRRSSCSGGRGRCFMRRTEISG